MPEGPFLTAPTEDINDCAVAPLQDIIAACNLKYDQIAAFNFTEAFQSVVEDVLIGHNCCIVDQIVDFTKVSLM